MLMRELNHCNIASLTIGNIESSHFLSTLLSLWERFYFEARFLTLNFFPNFEQLILMKCTPLFHHSHGSVWQTSRKNSEIRYVIENFMLAILGMKVRRRMVVKVHSDDDSVKPRNLRHR